MLGSINILFKDSIYIKTLLSQKQKCDAMHLTTPLRVIFIHAQQHNSTKNQCGCPASAAQHSTTATWSRTSTSTSISCVPAPEQWPQYVYNCGGVTTRNHALTSHHQSGTNEVQVWLNGRCGWAELNWAAPLASSLHDQASSRRAAPAQPVARRWVGI